MKLHIPQDHPNMVDAHIEAVAARNKVKSSRKRKDASK